MNVIINSINNVEIISAGQTTLSNLTKMQVVKEFPELFWCNDLLFSFEYNEERIDGDTLYLDTFYYAESAKVSSVKFEGYAVEVIDYTNFEIFENITKELKK